MLEKTEQFPDGENSVLVTGASGFVGRVLLQELIRKGWNVKAAVRNYANLFPGVQQCIIADVGSKTDWSNALSGVSHVIHLAGVAHKIGPAAINWMDKYYQVNAAGTRQLAIQAAAAKVGVFIHISSIGVLGSFSKSAVAEEDEAKPDSAYGQSKLDGERLVAATFESSSTRYCILRPPLVYGPGNPGNMARLMKLVKTGLPLPLSGIDNKRSFIYVGNLVDAICVTLKSDEALNRIYHVADAEVISTPELIRMIAKSVGCSSRLFSCPLPLLRMLALLGDGASALLKVNLGIDTYSYKRLVGSLPVSTRRIRTELNWHPPFSLWEGLSTALAPVVNTKGLSG